MAECEVLGDAVTIARISADVGLAGRVDHPTALGYLDGNRCMACHAAFRVTEGVATGGRARIALRAAGELWVLTDTLWATGWAALCGGRFDLSRELTDELEELGLKLHHGLGLSLRPRITGPREFYICGDADALEASAVLDAERANELLGGGAWIAWAYAWQGHAHFLRGDWDRAGDLFRRAAESAIPSAWSGWCTAAWFLYLARTGRRDEALACFDSHRDRLPIAGRPNVTGSWGLLLAFVEGMVELGEPDLAGAWYPLIVELQESTGALIAQYAPGQLIERVAAIGATAAGDDAAAEAHFRRALEQADQLPHEFEKYETRRWYAQLLEERNGPGDADRARRLRQEAVDGFTRLGMPRHAGLARATHA